jgi:hypothetical protein
MAFADAEQPELLPGMEEAAAPAPEPPDAPAPGPDPPSEDI